MSRTLIEMQAEQQIADRVATARRPRTGPPAYRRHALARGLRRIADRIDG